MNMIEMKTQRINALRSLNELQDCAIRHNRNGIDRAWYVSTMMEICELRREIEALEVAIAHRLSEDCLVVFGD